MGGINRELAFLLDSRSFMSTNYNQSMYDRVKARPRRDCTDNESDKKKKKRRKKKKKLSRRHRLERQNRRNNKINEKFDEIENTEKHCTDEDMKEKIREIKRSISEFKANLSSSSCSSEDSSNSSDNSSGSDDDDSSNTNSNSSSEKSSHSSNSLTSSSSSSPSDQDSDLETKSAGSDMTPSKRLKKSRHDRKSKSRLGSDDEKQPDENSTEFSVVDRKEKGPSSKSTATAPLTLQKLSHNLELASNCSMSSAGSSSGHGTKRRQSNDEDLTFSSNLNLSSKKANLNTDNQTSKSSRKRQKSNDSLFDSEECNVHLDTVSVAVSQLSPNKFDEAKAVERPKPSKPAVQSPKSIPSSKEVNVCKRQRVDSVTSVPSIAKPAANVSNEETIVKKRKLTDDSSVKNSPAKPAQAVTQSSSAKPVSSNTDQNKVKKAAPVASSTTVKPGTLSNTKSASGLPVKKESSSGTPTPKASSSLSKVGNEQVSTNKLSVKVKPAVSSPCPSQVKAKETTSTGETKKTSSCQVAPAIKTDANKPSKNKTSSSSTTKTSSVDSGAKPQSNQVAPTKVPTSSGSSKPNKQLKQISMKENPVVAAPVVKSDSAEHVLLMSAKSTLSSSSSSSIGGGIEDEPLTLSTIIKTESKNMQNNLKNKKMLLMMSANEEDEREVDQAVKSIFEATNKPIVNTVGLLSNETVKCEPIEEETSQILDDEVEEPCAARKTVSVDSSTPEVILSVLDQIKGEKVEVLQHDEEEAEEPVIASTEPMEERYDETHTTTETTEAEAAAIAILSCSQKMQVETVADASVLSAHEEEEAKPIEHVSAEETATSSTVTGLELLTTLIEMKQQEEILVNEEEPAPKEEEQLIVPMDLQTKLAAVEQRFCDDFVDMNKQQHDYLNETSESKDLPRETSEAVSVLLDLGLEKKLFPMPAYTGKKQCSKGSTSSTDSMSEFKSITSSGLLPFSSDLSRIESSLSLLTNDADAVNNGMDQQAHFHMEDAQKLAADKSHAETEADEPQTASFHSPTMLVLNQTEQLEFNPSKMDLNATMSLSISLNNLNQIESSEHMSTEAHVQNNASKQFNFEDTQHNTNSLMLNQADSNEQSMQELDKQADLNLTHQDNVPQSQQQSQLYELAFNMNTNSNINPEVGQNDQPLYKNTDSNVQDFGARNKNLGKFN